MFLCGVISTETHLSSTIGSAQTLTNLGMHLRQILKRIVPQGEQEVS